MRSGRSIANSAMVLLCALCLPGCSGLDDARYDYAANSGRPAWVDALAESTEVIPPQSSPPMRSKATPTAMDSSSIPKGGGQPANLTKRVSGPDATAMPEPIARESSGNQPQPLPAIPSATVELLLRNQTSEPDPATTDEPPTSNKLLKPSTLEEMYRGSLANKPDRDLDQFGYAFFAREHPDADAWPLAETYIVRPGDEIIVSLAGSVDGIHKLIVLRDGTINVPEVGTIPVGGRQVKSLQALIAEWIAKEAHRDNVRVGVSIGQARGFPVQVVGEVCSPGIIDVTGRATVLTALALADGPAKSGSLRNITLRRRGEADRTIDLYDFLMRGDASQLEFLRPDDTILVPPIGPTVAVAGFVQRPAIYESLVPVQPLTVGLALELAGGTTPFTFVPHAQIERTVNGRDREAIDLRLDAEGLSLSMGDGELLLVGAVNSDTMPIVRLSGQVIRPGDYEHRPGMRVSDLLKLGDNLKVEAFLPQAFLSRQIGHQSDITLHSGRAAIQTARRIMVIDLEKAYAGDPVHDVALMPLDHLEVTSQFEASERPTVTAIGAVRRPGTYELTAGMRISDLLAIAGNLTPKAFYDEAELIRRVYEPGSQQLGIQRYRFNLRSVLDRGADHDAVLENFDQVIIRTLRDTKIQVTIEGQVPFPGEYVFAQGAKISDLIAAAGGALDTAEIRATKFSRRSVAKLQNKRFEDLKERTRALYEATLEQMVQTGKPQEGLAARLSLDQTKELLDRMDNHQSTGRVVIPFLTAEFVNSDFDLTLEAGDHLKIPAKQQTVAILGHVFNPGSFVAENDLQVDTLLSRSGGINEQGDDERLYVIRADGVVQSLEQSNGRLRHSTTLLPGDVVLVPRRPLSRSFGHKLADLLLLARRAAETGFIIDKIGSDSDLNFSSILNEGFSNDVNVVDDTLIKK